MNMNIETLKQKIEKMSKQQQIEILRILKNKNSKLNENKSGIYINLSFLHEDTISEIRDYVQYIQNQEDNLSHIETQKMTYKDEFFTENE